MDYYLHDGKSSAMMERVSALAYFFGWRIVRVLPERWAYGIFLHLADYLVKKNGKSVQRLRENLSRIRPAFNSDEMEGLVTLSMRSYLRYWCDTFRIQDWSTERVQSTVTLTNGNLLLEPMRQGKGVVIALPHSGNWDHAGAYFCSLGIPLVTVAERLKPEALFQRFLRYRESMGFEVLSIDSRSFATLVRRAKEKRLIALVADRDLSASGVNVDFFGFPSRMPAGPALLAIKTGIPLVVAHVSYTEFGIHIEFTAVDVADVGSESDRVSQTVQRMANLFEKGISAHPEDWHMLQRIWTDGDFREHR
jgi:phosphatidylinositol dimannoside acyltransferase